MASVTTQGEAIEKVWVVVRVRKGSTSLDDASLHTGFTDPRPAHLICDILNDQHQNSKDEFRVVEMPRPRVLQMSKPKAS